MSGLSDKLWNGMLLELQLLHEMLRKLTSINSEDTQSLRQHLDAYIDARIAEKAPKPFPVTMVTAKDFDAAGEYIRAGTPLVPKTAPRDTEMRAALKDYNDQVARALRTDGDYIPNPSPTAREVHEAWKKHQADYVKHLFRVQYSGRTEPPPKSPSFPELET